jgi:hypothetical protein
VNVEPMTEKDAVGAAEMWRQVPHLSLADRTCLALARRLNATALTRTRSGRMRPALISKSYGRRATNLQGNLSSCLPITLAASGSRSQ